MSTHTEQLLSQLHKVIADLEGLARTAAGTVGQEGEEAAGRLKEALAGARERIRDAEQGLHRGAQQGARAADSYVHEHTWMSIGVAAAVAFLLGALTARRD